MKNGYAILGLGALALYALSKNKSQSTGALAPTSTGSSPGRSTNPFDSVYSKTRDVVVAGRDTATGVIDGLGKVFSSLPQVIGAFGKNTLDKAKTPPYKDYGPEYIPDYGPIYVPEQGVPNLDNVGLDTSYGIGGPDAPTASPQNSWDNYLSPSVGYDYNPSLDSYNDNLAIA